MEGRFEAAEDGMINVLVTGGAGYIGSHCCKELRSKGYVPIVLDNLVYGHRENVKWGEFLQGDIGNQSDLRICFNKYEIHAVMHFAAFAYVGESMHDPIKYYKNNVANTIGLLHAMVANGVKYFIFSSSCATYGNPIKIPMDENHPKNPINPYGKTKHMIEEMLKDYDQAYGMKFTSLRYFNAAGADPDGEIGEDHNPETHLIPLALEAASNEKNPFYVFGTDYPTPDGTAIRDYVHVTDLADAHVRALEYLLGGGENGALNLGTGRGNSVNEVITAIARLTGKRVPARDDARRLGDPPVLVADAARAAKILKWHPQHSDLTDIIMTAWRWHSFRHS